MALVPALGPLIERIQAAALDPGEWSNVVDGIAGLCQAQTGIIYELDHSRGRSTVLGAVGIDPAMADLYERHYHRVDPWNRHATAARVGKINLTHEFLADEDLRRTEFYQDHLRLSGIFYALGGTVERSTDHMLVLGVQRSHRKGPFRQSTAEMVQHLTPHLRQAHLAQRKMRSATQACANLTETLHLVPSPVMIVDGEGRLQFANRAAERLLASNDGLRLSRGIIMPASREQAAMFSAALAGVASDDGGQPSHDIAIYRPTGGQPLILHFSRLPRAENQERTRIAIFVDLAARLSQGAERLQRALRLTRAEARLLAGLLAGDSLSAFAERHGVSVNTLRVQLTSLFRKTGTHRQAELIRLALTAGAGGAQER